MNPSYGEGMASSLQTGLRHLEPGAQAALIVLADQPFLQPQTIDLLIHEYQSKRPEIVIPTYNGLRGNPVLLDRSVFGEVAELTGDVGFRAIFGKHTQGILRVAVQDSGVLVDLDSPSDVQGFEGLRCS
jgi:molybdenum cofactor cytidylyltransferase